ncbi:hypothetical protein BCR32DRAFT_329813 [Anaeromyces robustus]|uniref:AAA-ATPase-like domain-containing protein n=1 Tax=Anaeromyces robustus TaxID=1754192 RepID=A0A1Y1WPF6_9FUNG|nr:hypothetical protein BCR32DRAFT_329813 [Anaeromyces robustus]|eukprot:ORX75427.1 hypothetical protein BCR32DRAFT_329813 [Anaeromyces robustus]
MAYQKFKELCKNKYFVDKTNIIKKFNELLNSPINNVCITKPRRFGKSSIAFMIIAYYSKRRNKEFKEIFNKLNVSKNEDINTEKGKSKYEETMGKYHTIYLDFSKYHEGFKYLNDYIYVLEERVLYELKDNIEKNEHGPIILEKINNLLDLFEIKFNKLAIFLDYYYSITNEKFVFVIDEWDYIFSNDKYTINERNMFLSFLKNLLKDQAYIALTYMTGILPIAKRSSGSSLNCFLEYSMLKDDIFYEYFGFKEKEVEALCKINGKLKLEEMKEWYNGYSIKGENIFNPYSIINALINNSTGNYWTNTGPMKEIKENLNFNIYGIKDDFLKLITRESIKIELNGYGAENKQQQAVNGRKTKQRSVIDKNENMRNEMYSLMVVYGFLTYNNGEVKIPNKELLEKFKQILNDKNEFEIYNNLMNYSKKMLEATLTKNTKDVCQILEKVHTKRSTIKGYYDHITLEFIVKFAYFDAQNKYDIKQEETRGKGFVDFIFYPKHDNENKTVIILELKVGKSAEEAINQIYKKDYYAGLRRLGYKILLVGINCTKKDKKYDCIIEEYDENKSKQNQNNDDISEYSSNDQNKNKRKNNDYDQVQKKRKYDLRKRK